MSRVKFRTEMPRISAAFNSLITPSDRARKRAAAYVAVAPGTDRGRQSPHTGGLRQPYSLKAWNSWRYAASLIIPRSWQR